MYASMSKNWFSLYPLAMLSRIKLLVLLAETLNPIYVYFLHSAETSKKGNRNCMQSGLDIFDWHIIKQLIKHGGDGWLKLNKKPSFWGDMDQKHRRYEYEALE